jgi:hypothetical protein
MRGKTDSTGNVTITLPAGSNRANVTVWWKASWGVSYLVNFTGTTLFSTLNKSVINCSIYNVNLWTVDQRARLKRCKYAVVKIYDLNKSVLMYK